MAHPISQRLLSGASLMSVGSLILVACPMLGGCTQSGSSGKGSAALDYPTSMGDWRVGETIEALAPTEAALGLNDFSASPPLPAGIALDPDTGVITGVPQSSEPLADRVISASLAGEEERFETILEVRIAPSLPEQVLELQAGFAVEVIATDLDIPVRMVVAPDGRIFYNELGTGRVQVLDAERQIQPEPFASFEVLAGGHMGLLGLALSPAFPEDGRVFLSLCAPEGGGHGERMQLWRLVDDNSIGIDPTLLVDDLPLSEINNGGELCFDNTGAIFMSIGDNEAPILAQDPDSMSGKILRYLPDGGLPADNPNPDSPVWSLGQRNVFALTLHPQSGVLYGADNGPASNDRLLFLVPDKNFGWGYEGPGLGAQAGFAVRTWVDVITPTALAFQAGGPGWDDYEGELFLTTYNTQEVRRVQLLGDQHTDFHRELEFLRFADVGLGNTPLDLCRADDGSLYISTFDAIYRVYAF